MPQLNHLHLHNHRNVYVITSQWSQNSRIQSVDKAAGDAAKTLGKDVKMNIKLVRCK